MSTEALRRVSIFADLDQDDLERIASEVRPIDLPAGEVLFEEGEQGSVAYVIEAGEVEIVKITDGREVLLAVRGPGDVIGEMALLDESPRNATVRARTDTSLLVIPKAGLDDLLACSPGGTRVLFQALLHRWRETESRLRQSQRMAQLGTITAGLAHELNNPAAAIRRAAGQLAEAVDGYGEASSAVGQAALEIGADPRLAETISPDRAAELSALELSDREEELQQVLSAHGVDSPWELASDLAEAGADKDLIEHLVSTYGSEAVSSVAAAIAAGRRVHSLLQEVTEGASRLSAIVSALKSYSYLDRAPLQEVDVREGLDNTLLILKHQLTGVDVVREYADDTPVIEAYAPELNQVWTNLLDNAADALTEAGSPEPSVTIRTRAGAGDGVVVEIEDNGPGIPPEIQERVFDPFFTTKPPGSGTGLGLDIVYGIVVHKHRGEITLDSAAGRTLFRVALPPRPE